MVRNDKRPQWQNFADFATLERLLDDFAFLTGITTVIIDPSGEHITKQTLPYNELCMRLIRSTASGKQKCDECDLEWGNRATQEQTYKVYTCKHRLVDFAAPIMFEGQVLGYLFGGQVRAAEDPLDKEWHIQNARALGIDSAAYLQALDKIPVLPRDKIEAAARMLYDVANFISSLTAQWISEREEAREKEKVLASLQEVVADVIAELDLPTVLQKVVERTSELVRADIVTIHLYDPLIDEAYASAGYGLQDQETFEQHKPGRARVVLLVASRGEPIIADDVASSEFAGPFAAREEVQSAAGFPLKVGDKVIGVLFVSYRRVHQFEPEEVKTLISFGNLAAVAINAARLYEQARTLREVSSTISSILKRRKISSALISAPELKDVAERILDELAKVIEYRKASLQLIRGDQREMIAYRGPGQGTIKSWMLPQISRDPLIRRIVDSKEPLILECDDRRSELGGS